MNWFYAKQDKTQAGPVDDSTLNNLLRSGEITQETLIWKEGMADWASYASVFHPPAQVAPAPGVTRCTECGQMFPPEQVITLAGRPVCAACKPVAVQKLQEGVVGFGPAADAGELWKRVETRGYDFTIGSVLSRTWNLVKGNFWPCVGVTLLCYLVLMGSQQIPFLGLLAVFLVQPQIMAGLNWYFLKQFRGEPATLNDGFEGFRRGYGQQAIYMLIMMGIILGFVAVCGILAALVIPVLSGALTEEQKSIGLVLFLVVVGIPFLLGMWYLMICWIFSSLLILDKGLKATAAMKLSRRVVKLRFWKTVGLFFVIGLLSMVSLLVFCVGILVMLPIAFGSVSRLYEDIFGDQNASPTV